MQVTAIDPAFFPHRQRTSRGRAEILGDGRTVWVNAEDGTCIGRFSRFGIDVHNDAAAQKRTGKECLLCTHERPVEADWERFREAMKAYHAVEVPDGVRPAFVIAV